MSITIGGEHAAPHPIATQLHANGFEGARTSHGHSSDGTSSSTWAVRGWHVLVAPDGTRADFAPARNIATLTLQYLSDRSFDAFSPVAQRFADALVEAFIPTRTPAKRPFQKRVEPAAPPLIRRTAKSLEIVWRASVVSAHLRDLSRHHRPELYSHGIATTDQRSPLSLVAGFPDIPVGDGATWLNGRDLLSVHRDSLPQWDNDAASNAVAELVNRWVTAGDIEISSGYQERRA
jgi:hypothetical protein